MITPYRGMNEGTNKQTKQNKTKRKWRHNFFNLIINNKYVTIFLFYQTAVNSLICLTFDEKHSCTACIFSFSCHQNQLKTMNARPALHCSELYTFRSHKHTHTHACNYDESKKSQKIATLRTRQHFKREKKIFSQFRNVK